MNHATGSDVFGGPFPFGEIVDRVRRHYDDGCFACGRENPFGLAMDDFTRETDAVTARFRPAEFHRGTFGSLHGGLAVTALDEIMAWAGIVIEDVLCVTANIQIRFRRPVPIGRELIVRGRRLDRSGRRLRLTGELVSDGVIAIEGSGVYVVSHQVGDLLKG